MVEGNPIAMDEQRIINIVLKHLDAIREVTNDPRVLDIVDDCEETLYGCCEASHLSDHNDEIFPL